jgi:hypothetical protein
MLKACGMNASSRVVYTSFPSSVECFVFVPDPYIYCVPQENITPTSLQFRMAVNYPRGFSAGDTGATLRTWGMRDGDSCHQYIGSRPVHDGLAIVFPNIYQHHQTSFTLLDSSKPGHQTVIAFFLVDPEVQPVVSTAMVAPQQKQ